MARRKKSPGAGFITSVIELAFSLVFLLVKLAIQLLLLPFRLMSGGASGQSRGSRSKSGNRGPAPKFKDFRYSGSTYEESQANYEKAYEQWQYQGGAELADAEEARRTQRAIQKNSDWLDKRWDRAKREQKAGQLQTFQEWYFHQPSGAQVERLGYMGMDALQQKLTKGQASDIIGLFEPADNDQLEVLKFFKQSTAAMNQTKAKELSEVLLASPWNLASWEARPATPLDKEFYRFMGLKCPKGLTHAQAAEDIERRLEEARREAEEAPQESDDECPASKDEQWEAFSEAFEEITSLEFVRDNDIKRPSLSAFRKAVESLQAEGKVLSEDLDVYDIRERLVEQDPDIEKFYD